MVDVIFLPHFW